VARFRHTPDRTVGFWIKRMAQETVIYRIDAELATRQTVASVPDELALDGIDERLKVFVAYSVARPWPSSAGCGSAKTPRRPPSRLTALPKQSKRCIVTGTH